MVEKTRRPYQLFTAESNLLASELRKIHAEFDKVFQDNFWDIIANGDDAENHIVDANKMGGSDNG